MFHRYDDDDDDDDDDDNTQHCSPCWALDFLVCFVRIYFFRVGLLAPHPTPNLEAQGIPFWLDHHLSPVWQGRPYQ
jgi:hypothetical protein